MVDRSVGEKYMSEKYMCGRLWVKSLWVKNGWGKIDKNRGRWDAGFRSPPSQVILRTFWPINLRTNCGKLIFGKTQF